jgi:16S rRNA (guanine527-N7)-methyltransferase
VELIKEYFPNLAERQWEQLTELKALYEFWNSQINVISRKDMDAFYLHHVLHSLSIAKFIQFKPKTRILDLGTGGGFPGIPLAIMFPEVAFHLIDGRQKKIKVVEEVIKSLDLENAIAQAVRAEELKMKYDFVTARAVTQLDQLVIWCQRLISNKQINATPNGLIALKGGDLREELKQVKLFKEITDIHNYFPLPYFEEKRILYIQI